MKNVTSWILTAIGTVSIAVSLALIFPTETLATCNLTVTCANGAVKSCSGEHCETTNGGYGVRCTINGKVTPESGDCPGDLEIL